MKEASKLFEGYHDFKTFMQKNVIEEKITRKDLEYIRIIKRDVPGYSHYSWPSLINNEQDSYLPLDIYIKGRSFLYRQVRKSYLKFPAN